MPRPLVRTGDTWILFSLGMYLTVGGTFHYIRVCARVCPPRPPYRDTNASINCLKWLQCMPRLH